MIVSVACVLLFCFESAYDEGIPQGLSNMDQIPPRPTFFSAETLAMAGIAVSDYRAVYRFTPGRPGISVIWTAPERVRALRVSPTENRIAVLHWAGTLPNNPQYVATILSAHGDVLTSLSDVYALDWSPDGQSLVYATGDYSDSGPDCTGVWLSASCSDEEPQRIADDGQELTWSGRDDAIYLATPKKTPGALVMSYALQQRDIGPTHYLGIHFSPNGSYYYDQGRETSARVFEADTNDEIVTRLPSCQGHGWISAHLLVLYSGQPPLTYLYDCASRKAREVSGLPFRASADEKHVLVLKEDRTSSVEPISGLKVFERDE